MNMRSLGSQSERAKSTIHILIWIIPEWPFCPHVNKTIIPLVKKSQPWTLDCVPKCRASQLDKFLTQET